MDEVQLVYQWIPPRVPQALGVLAGRINTTFRVSGDPWAAHRALYIPRPHPVLSGQYSCTVSTFEDEDTRSGHLLVWSESVVESFSFPAYMHFSLHCVAFVILLPYLIFLSVSRLQNSLDSFASLLARTVHPKE